MQQVGDGYFSGIFFFGAESDLGGGLGRFAFFFFSDFVLIFWVLESV